MTQFNYTPSTDGESADAVDINTGFQELETIINGNLGTDNILDNSITEAKLSGDIFTTVQSWISATGVTYLANNGSKQYQVNVTGDVTDTYSKGMRVELVPTTARGVKSVDLESGSSQYADKASPTGITFTDDFTVEAWVKLESLTGSEMHIVGRRNGSTEGWNIGITGTGALSIWAGRIASNNKSSTVSGTVPIGEWVHVACTMDLSGSVVTTYINGKSVNNTITTNGTITALVQGTTALVVGARNTPDLYFDGKIKDVRVWSDIRTEEEIQDNMNIELTGSEPNLVAYYKLEDDYTDETSNANDLTPRNAPVFATDSPFNATEYGIITDVSDYEEVTSGKTTLTLYTGTDHNVPNDTYSTARYSTQYAPFDYPNGLINGVAQQVGKQYSEITTGTTIIPLDDTIPQNTEGFEVMQQSIAPQNAENMLLVEATIFVANSNATQFITAALFRDSGADAINVVNAHNDAANGSVTLTFAHRVVAGSTTPTTFKVRIGSHQTTTSTFNGRAGARLYGAIPKSSITITEYRA